MKDDCRAPRAPQVNVPATTATTMTGRGSSNKMRETCTRQRVMRGPSHMLVPVASPHFSLAAAAGASAAAARKNTVPKPRVRYVRPKEPEKREQLYAYYAAKGLLAGDGDDVAKGTQPSASPVSSDTNKDVSGGGEGAGIATLTVVDIDENAKKGICGCPADSADESSPAEEGLREAIRAQMRPCSTSPSRPDTAKTEKRMLEELQHLVCNYEKQYNRKSGDWSPRTFTVPSLAPLVRNPYDDDDDDSNEAAVGRQEEASDATVEESSNRTVSPLPLFRSQNSRRNVDKIGGYSGSSFSNSRASTPLPLPSRTADDADPELALTLSTLRVNPLLGEADSSLEDVLALPHVFRSGLVRGRGSTPHGTLATEQERRSQSVRHHVLQALMSLPAAAPTRHDQAHHLTAISGFRGHPFKAFTGVCETLLDVPVEAMPQSHLTRLLDCLAEDPALQRCAEAAARLVTYVLMHSLPAELYEGDPEDYRKLRARNRCAADTGSSPMEASSAQTGRARTYSPRPQSPPPQMLSSHSERRNDKMLGSHRRRSGSSHEPASGATDRYFLHTDSMSLTQALQSVALRKGFWLSSTVPMMVRPPLHACGLPLRTAREIALWQRPPGAADAEVAVLNDDNDDGGDGGGGGGGSSGGTMNVTDVNVNIAAAYTKPTPGSASEKLKLLSQEEADDWRPKTLAPLLIIAYGGYGVAPFSTREPSSQSAAEGDKSFAAALGRDAFAEENDTILSAMNNFMHPEPALLPLHSVMQAIYRSVRQNRLMCVDETTADIPPAFLELLMDVVKSYESFFQSVLSMSFEPASARSFFVHTYRETLLSWAAIAICEGAIGHATERAGHGPANVRWSGDAEPEKFTEEQLEEIALSGLVEKTFPNMSQWGYDEQLFLRTIETLRSVVLETIGRVKGELYYLITGVDKRGAVLEQYRERLRQGRALRAEMRARAEEQLQARLPGGGGGSSQGPAPSASEMLNQNHRAATQTLPVVQQLSTTMRSTTTGRRRRRRRPNTASDTFNGAATYSTFEHTHLAPALRPWQPSYSYHAAHRYLQDGASHQEYLSSDYRPASALVQERVEIISTEVSPLVSHSYSSMQRRRSEASCTASAVASAPAHAGANNEHLPRRSSSAFARRSTCSPERRSVRRPVVSDVPEYLTVRSVRRELVALKFRARLQPSTAVTPEANTSIQAPMPGMAPTVTAQGNAGTPADMSAMVNRLSPTPSPGPAAPIIDTPTQKASLNDQEDVTLAAIVGCKQAAAVARLRKACENTAQFHLHCCDPESSGGGGKHTGVVETHWYAAGSLGFYERRTVACIKRTRQVAAFDLHHLSPITALRMCMRRPGISDHGKGGVREDQKRLVHPQEQQQQQHQPQKREALKPKELHLGEAMMPWTL